MLTRRARLVLLAGPSVAGLTGCLAWALADHLADRIMPALIRRAEALGRALYEED